jgi:amino acid adenylation domain-containing protein
LSNYAFDGSVFDIYGALLNSAALVMIDREDVLAVDRLAGVIKREAITVFFATTALFNALVDVDIGCLAGVRKVLFGGERVSPGHSGKALEYLGKGRIIHVYGPTETTVYATYYFIDGIDERSGTVPIGRPISNTTVYIVDKYWQPVPPGVSGEVYIGGTGTARGYLNNPELTAEKFFECGFYRSYRTHRTYILYRTGDLARWLPGGNIEFIGRIDDQVKIRGFRIEPGEIESRLLNHNRVKEAVVLTRENSSGDKFLCAYVAAAPVKQNEPDVTVSELREYLAGDLPDYMIPPHIVILDKMPLMPNGKIDRAALPVPEEGAAARRSVYTAPGNRVEKKLVEIWSEVLSVDRDILGIDANFFEVGGHSLKAFLLVSKIHKTFEVNVPLTEIFSHPTIREMAGYIEASKRDRFFMIDPPELKEYYPLSSAQKRLYILQQMDPGGTAYNMLFFMTLEGKLETVEFESTFKKLVDRHESLRTSFEMVGGEPVQRIHQDVEFENEYYDLTAGGIITNFTRSFDLLRPPLLRTGLIREEEQKHLLMVDMHHIISDGTSLGIFAREFMSLYNGEDLPPLTIQYKDFSQWQNRLFQSEEMKRQESFWLDQFEGDVPVLELPSDFNRPRVLTFEGSYMSTSIGAKETAALKELALEEGVTLFMVLTVVFNILFARLSGQEDIVIGTPTAGRRHVDLQGVIGMFVNTLPLRNFPNGEKTIIAFLREVKEQTLRAFDNQDYPFEELVNRLGVVRDTSRNPLFDVMFSMQNLDMPEVEIPGITLKPHPAGLNIAKFDMVATITEAGEMLSFDINYRTALFKPETIEKFFAYFSNVLSSFLENPHQRTADVRMITDAEKQQVLYDFNQTAEDYPADKTICELFEEQAGMRPDHAAVIGVDQRLGARGYAPLHMDHVSLTYRELNEKSNRLAHYLVERGVTPGRPVGILADRSPGMIIGILGILKAGCGYVPLDPRAPLTRTNYILGECRVKIVLTLTHLINRDNTFFENYLYLCIDEYESYSNRPDTDPGKNPAAGDWAYVIFTSGSTGKPKGVPITHANISPLLHWGYRHLEMGPKDRSLQNLSYYFDWAVWEIFITLTTGAGLYMVPEDLLLNPKECIAFIRKHDITVLHATPSHYRYFVNVGQRLETLKYLLLGAEKLTQDLVQRSFESVSSHCRVFNMYGPTETTIISAVLEIQREEQDKFQHLSGVPIGSPVANTTLLVLDSNLNLCPVNVTGELYIGGDGTAAGYLNRPELTAEKFKEHRSYRSYRSYSLYRTGDLARWLPDGNIEFLGRKDFQVKVRGYRIELGEIEACLSKHPKVKEAVILAMTNEGGNKFFCAYVILSGSFYNPSAMTEELKNYLSRLLPDYMVPSHFVELEKIPMTRNGKIDRKALPQPVFHAAADYIKPQTPGEKAVAFIWREVLGVDDVGIDDNFFELGGNSLNIIQLGLRLKEALRNDIPTVVLFRFPTIRTFLEYVQKEEGGDREKEKEKDRLKAVDRGKRMMTRAINRRDMKGV